MLWTENFIILRRFEKNLVGSKKQRKVKENRCFFAFMSASALEAIAKILRDRPNEKEKFIQEAWD
jgi:hypothetical protein